MKKKKTREILSPLEEFEKITEDPKSIEESKASLETALQKFEEQVASVYEDQMGVFHDKDELRLTPWITPAAFSLLKLFTYNNPEAKYLEFGCGGSTIWLAERVKYLVSIEHRLKWYEKVRKHIEENVQLLKNSTFNLRNLERPYFRVCDEFQDEFFDFILVDAADRKECAFESIRILKSGGWLMIDNAELEPKPHFKGVEKIYEMLNSWQFILTKQTKEMDQDLEGFFNKRINVYHHNNWQTNIWIKP